jgi:hypothetical protein
MRPSLLISVLLLAAAQPEAEPDEKAHSAARLDFMTEAAARIQFHEEVWTVPLWKPHDADEVYDIIGPFAVKPELISR